MPETDDAASGPALKAHFGDGTKGYFTAELSGSCQGDAPACLLWGTSQEPDGTLKDRFLGPGGGADISQAIGSVPAIDTGDPYIVYPIGGGTAWEARSIKLAAAAGVILVILVAEISGPLYLGPRRWSRLVRRLRLMPCPVQALKTRSTNLQERASTRRPRPRTPQ